MDESEEETVELIYNGKKYIVGMTFTPTDNGYDWKPSGIIGPDGNEVLEIDGLPTELGAHILIAANSQIETLFNEWCKRQEDAKLLAWNDATYPDPALGEC